MIRVTRIVELKRQPIEDRKGYLIECKETEGYFAGGFVEFISRRNMPRVNQKFNSFRELEDYCRGIK